MKNSFTFSFLPALLVFTGILGANFGFSQAEDYWKTDGNNVGAGSFIGTKNASGLHFRSNNLERMILTEQGNVGI